MPPPRSIQTLPSPVGRGVSGEGGTRLRPPPQPSPSGGGGTSKQHYGGTKMNIRRLVHGLSFLIVLGALTIAAVAIPQTVQISGKITLKQADGTEVPATGTVGAAPVVTVNGTSAISGATVFSDSTVTTA